MTYRAKKAAIRLPRADLAAIVDAIAR